MLWHLFCYFIWSISLQRTHTQQLMNHWESQRGKRGGGGRKHANNYFYRGLFANCFLAFTAISAIQHQKHKQKCNIQPINIVDRMELYSIKIHAIKIIVITQPLVLWLVNVLIECFLSQMLSTTTMIMTTHEWDVWLKIGLKRFQKIAPWCRMKTIW